MNMLIVAATDFEITSLKIRKQHVLCTGIGMVNTAVSLTKELVSNKYDLIINMGVAGAFSEDLVNGCVVEVIEDNFSEIGFENDLEFMQFTDFDIQTRFYSSPRTNLKQVRAITVNTVHGNNDTISEIVKREKADIETMEGASVFKVCEEFNIPCLQIRSISNRIEKRNTEQWDLDLAIRNLNFEVEKIINNL
ncbi:MAG: futalosine hydrolase [Flavobacteriales bacterium]|nr:futalosine hydrolase [Flavobacteriales bacterium]